MHHFRRLTGKKHSYSASAERLKREEKYFKHGSGVLEELLALCDGNCRIPLRYFSAVEIEKARKHCDEEIDFSESYMKVGSLDKHLVLLRFMRSSTIHFSRDIYRDIAITAQMSHLKNVLKLVGCCLEYEEPVMVYEYVEAITLDKLLFKKDNHDQTRKSISWGSRLRIANEVASAVVFLHTEFPTPIIHRNLKPSHVIIDENSCVAKIMDFSLSVSLPPGELEVEDEVIGTFGYADPEYIRSGIVTQKTDVYNFGVVLFQLLTGKKKSLVDGLMTDCGRWGNESNIEVGNVMDIVDPVILEERGIAIRQQMDDYLNLVKKCTASKGEDRPYMIDVAKELRRIENCFRALPLVQN